MATLPGFSSARGTYGARRPTACGPAVVRATEKVIAKARKTAANTLEAADTDIGLTDARFRIASTDTRASFGRGRAQGAHPAYRSVWES